MRIGKRKKKTKDEEENEQGEKGGKGGTPVPHGASVAVFLPLVSQEVLVFMSWTTFLSPTNSVNALM